MGDDDTRSVQERDVGDVPALACVFEEKVETPALPSGTEKIRVQVGEQEADDRIALSTKDVCHLPAASVDVPE